MNKILLAAVLSSLCHAEHDSNTRPLNFKERASFAAAIKKQNAEVTDESLEKIRKHYPKLKKIVFVSDVPAVIRNTTEAFLRLPIPEDVSARLDAEIEFSGKPPHFVGDTRTQIFGGLLQTAEDSRKLHEVMMLAHRWNSRRNSARVLLKQSPFGRLTHFTGDFDPSLIDKWADQLHRISKRSDLNLKGLRSLTISNQNPRIKFTKGERSYLNASLNLPDNDLVALLNEMALAGRKKKPLTVLSENP